QQTEAPTQTEAPRAYQSINAAQLYFAYENNEIAADNKYRGQGLKVTGTVDSVGKDFLDHPHVYLDTPNEFSPIHAQLAPSAVPKASTLQKGQLVELYCVGSGLILESTVLS